MFASSLCTLLHLNPSFTSSHMFCSIKETEGNKRAFPTPTQNKSTTQMPRCLTQGILQWIASYDEAQSASALTYHVLPVRLHCPATRSYHETNPSITGLSDGDLKESILTKIN